MYNIESVKIDLIVNGKRLRRDILLEGGNNLVYEEVFDYLSEMFHMFTNDFDEMIYDEIDVIDNGDDYNE